MSSGREQLGHTNDKKITSYANSDCGDAELTLGSYVNVFNTSKKGSA